MFTSSPAQLPSTPVLANSVVASQTGVTVTFEQVFFGGTALFISLSIGAGKWLLDREVKRVANRFEDLYKRVGEVGQACHSVDQRMDDFRLQVSQQYVSREDYLRHQTLTEAKLDAVHRRLDQMMDLLMRGKGNG